MNQRATIPTFSISGHSLHVQASTQLDGLGSGDCGEPLSLT